jgi:hypothetical protein
VIEAKKRGEVRRPEANGIESFGRRGVSRSLLLFLGIYRGIVYREADQFSIRYFHFSPHSSSWTMQQEQQQEQQDKPTDGYPPSMFVTQPPPERLPCRICLGVMRDPVQVCGNQHVYCRGCIGPYNTKRAKRCPSCNAPLIVEMPPAIMASEWISEHLQVRCPHAGCNGGSGGSGSGSGSSSSNNNNSSSSKNNSGNNNNSADAADGHQHKRSRTDDGAGPSSVPASCE